MAALVEKVTAALSGTSLTDSPSSKDAVSQSAAEGRRLYIGNLAYATTEAELKDFFKDYLVESTSIPTNPRTSRPVGYAFVDVSTPTEAERAVNELNGQNILERKVSVQLARKPEESAPAAAATSAETNGDANGAPRKRASGRGRGRGRGGRGGRARGARDGEAADAEDGEEVAAIATEPLTAADGTAAPSKTKTPRPPRQRGPPEDGVPSKTKIMVANLPYDLMEDKLLEIFKAYEPTAAKLALRPIPRFMVRKLQARNEPRKGRGFAFVTCGSEELQQKAIAEMNGKEVEGRELAVKVAIDSPGKEEEALEAQASEVEATETTTEAATATA